MGGVVINTYGPYTASEQLTTDDAGATYYYQSTIEDTSFSIANMSVGDLLEIYAGNTTPPNGKIADWTGQKYSLTNPNNYPLDESYQSLTIYKKLDGHVLEYQGIKE